MTKRLITKLKSAPTTNTQNNSFCCGTNFGQKASTLRNERRELYITGALVKSEFFTLKEPFNIGFIFAEIGLLLSMATLCLLLSKNGALDSIAGAY